MSDERRYDTVTAAEGGTPEDRGDVDRAADIVAGLGDATPLRSVAAVIVGFVVLTLGSVAAGWLLGDPAGVGAAATPDAGATPDAVPTTSFALASLGSRFAVAVLAGALTARAAPGRPFVHGLALAALITLMSVASLLGLRAAGGLDESAWYPVVMLFIGPAGILLGACLAERFPRRRPSRGPDVGHALVALALAAGAAGCVDPGGSGGETADAPAAAVAEAPAADQDPLLLPGDRNFVSGYETFPDSATIHVLVEIPAGTNDKWQATKTGEALEWEIEDGAPRVVRYLAYPANYGMIPRTVLPAGMGGDGDPLDVLLLGPALARGSVVTARPVGVLRLLDGGEQDDKVLAVPTTGPFAVVTDLDGLRSGFPGALEIIETWFSSYKGPGEIEALGYAGVEAAIDVIRYAADAYEAWAACGSLADGQGHGPDPFGNEWWAACRRRMEGAR